jgi:hypothetical protein
LRQQNHFPGDALAEQVEGFLEPAQRQAMGDDRWDIQAFAQARGGLVPGPPQLAAGDAVDADAAWAPESAFGSASLTTRRLCH